MLTLTVIVLCSTAAATGLAYVALSALFDRLLR
jgi:hypothetical protein